MLLVTCQRRDKRKGGTSNSKVKLSYLIRGRYVTVHLIYPGQKERKGLTLKVPIATKVVCFSHLLKCLRSLYGKQCRPVGAVCSGPTLFASILYSSVMLHVGDCLLQTTSADNIFRCIFSLRSKGFNLFTAKYNIK